MTEIATVDQGGTLAAAQGGSLALRADQTEWSPVQQAALAHIGIEKAPPADQQVFMHVCQRTGLDPFNKEIYMIGRRERGRNGEPDSVKWTIQTGIDGFRKRAEQHPQYAGTLDPEWCGTDGVWRDVWVEPRPPVAARVRVLRHDRQHPITLPVRFAEFAATYGDGNLQGQWKTKPAHMIEKVAEAASLRKAFPETFAGLFTDDEMAHTENVRPPRGMTVEHAPAVTAAELTGQAPPARPVTQEQPVQNIRGGSPVDAQPEQPAAQEKPARKTAPRKTRSTPEQPAEAPAGDKPDPKAMNKLFALIGKSDIDDRQDWASGVLGRDVASFGTLTAAEVSRLIDRLEAPPSDEPIEAELVEDEPTAEQLQAQAELDSREEGEQ